MITKQSTTAGYWRWLAVGIGLVSASALLIVAMLLADGAGATSAAFGLRTRLADVLSALGLSGSSPVAHMYSAPLGIEMPHGAGPQDLPAGLREYVYPASLTRAASTPPYQLGINLPHGADMRTLPAGLADYIRPQDAARTLAAPSTVLGITLPSGARRSDLPPGVTDYLRASR